MYEVLQLQGLAPYKIHPFLFQTDLSKNNCWTCWSDKSQLR